MGIHIPPGMQTTREQTPIPTETRSRLQIAQAHTSSHPFPAQPSNRSAVSPMQNWTSSGQQTLQVGSLSGTFAAQDQARFGMLPTQMLLGRHMLPEPVQSSWDVQSTQARPRFVPNPPRGQASYGVYPIDMQSNVGIDPAHSESLHNVHPTLAHSSWGLNRLQMQAVYGVYPSQRHYQQQQRHQSPTKIQPSSAPTPAQMVHEYNNQFPPMHSGLVLVPSSPVQASKSSGPFPTQMSVSSSQPVPSEQDYLNYSQPFPQAGSFYVMISTTCMYNVHVYIDLYFCPLTHDSCTL